MDQSHLTRPVSTARRANGDPRLTNPDPHPLFTPRQTHPLPPPSVGERPTTPPPSGPIRSNFADFGDYDDEDGYEYPFVLAYPAYGSIAQRRIEDRGEDFDVVLGHQHAQGRHELELKVGAMADVDVEFKEIDYNPAPRNYRGEYRYAFEEMSPKSRIPKALNADVQKAREERFQAQQRMKRRGAIAEGSKQTPNAHKGSSPRLDQQGSRNKTQRKRSVARSPVPDEDLDSMIEYL
jgi:hypothetical protein